MAGSKSSKRWLAEHFDDSFDLVLSDTAPNMSGIAATDPARFMYLVELAFEFAR